MTKSLSALALGGLILVFVGGAAAAEIELRPLGVHASGLFEAGGAEIAAHDPATQRLFVVNGGHHTVDVLDIANPLLPALVRTIDMTAFGAAANSVAVRGGLVVAAVENVNRQAPGSAVFFDANGNHLKTVTVGALPDMVTFSPDGDWVLVANEGEPSDDYLVDPEGSVSVIDLRHGITHVSQSSVRTAGFASFNGAPPPGVRVFGPNATVAQDMEPEYITVSADSRTAWVSVQEANAIATIDIAHARVTHLRALGTKDHSRTGAGLDASDRDNAIRIERWPVHGLYLPDSIASYRFLGQTFLVTANEGDSRAYSAFDEEARIGSVALDPAAFPGAVTLQLPANLGRLKITRTAGDTDGDGDFDRLFTFGSRSFSIWTTSGFRVFDSGDALERITAAALPADFNSDNTENDSFDSRSDDKGPEPEGLAIGTVSGHVYAFLGLERIGGVAVFDVTIPFLPRFVQYVNTRDFQGDPETGTAGDLGPEGVLFIKAQDSPNGRPLLVTANEISGTTRLFEIVRP
jgi:2',3'-cyclic-nucleotide 2'-phosphodiesterase / 3'-nucleotidase / 5'-nucleotidase